jgi:protein TonB
MAFAALRTDERVGLGVAVVLHLALVAVLVMQPGKDEVPPMPERMTVSLASDVSLASTAPDPVAESRAAIAPTLSDEPQAATPIEQAQPEPIPAPRPVATTVPPRAAATRAAAQPPRRRPDRPAASPAPKPPAKPAGGSRRIVSQSGVTASNAPQKDLHAERAIRAVQLAAPFDLPPEYFEAWKRISSFRFDRNLN